VRIGWGFWGSESAQFKRFLRAPTHAVQHFKAVKHKRYQPSGTHNAAGGWFVLVLLSTLLLQGLTGLFATDAILFDGPLNHWISGDIAKTLTTIHKTNFDVILVLIGLHIAAVLLYRYAGYPLIEAMIHGKQTITGNAPVLRSGAIALVIALVLAIAGWWFI